MPASTALPDPLPWLLEPEEPGPRYLALRDMLHYPPDDPDLRQARDAAHRAGPIAAILAAMHPDGYWVEPGPGYLPKYASTVWALIALAQLGAFAAADERVGRACAYVLDHALLPAGQFSASTAPSGTADCLQGNLCAALLDLGGDDPRLDAAFDWMARSVTGEGVAPLGERGAPLRYYAGKCGPLFRCGANNKLPCAWGAAKVMLAFGKLPAARRTPLIDEAIRQGVEFLFSVDPATAAWPSGWAAKPSGNWWKFGFPVFYVTDLLQVVEALVALGHGDDPRLANARALIAGKADEQGRWPLEYDYAGKLWDGVDFGPKKRPNKWVTIRALQAVG
ncbi:nitrogen fixation protein NifH [Promineifilum sp.]|uniref:nitrogen fixation protein NifH n=1 Tax=Promineifilum sp. TaxID=2664178 RepID=UPI0035B292C2